MQQPAFVPSLPLACDLALTHHSRRFNPTARPAHRPRSATPSRRHPSTASLQVLRPHDEALSASPASPSPADWLRANEASLTPSRDTLRIGFVPSQKAPQAAPAPVDGLAPASRLPSPCAATSSTTAPLSIPRRNPLAHAATAPQIPFSTSPLSSSPSTASPLVAPTSRWPDTPSSYCNVATDVAHTAADLDARVFYLGPVARNKVVRALELARAAHAPPHIFADNVTVALMVADLQMDCDTVCAAILRNIVARGPGCPEPAVVADQVGADVLRVLEFHSQLEESVRLCVDASFTEMSFSNLRELILVRAADEHRAISLELARAVLAIRTVDSLPDPATRLAVARRTMYLYAPLANQLGIWFVQGELEELAFMYLEPESFDMIRHLVGERRRECEDMLTTSKEFLERILSRTPEMRSLVRTVRVKGRVKGLYSVYRKMRRSGKMVYEIYDLLALRVVIQSKKADEEAERAACYAVADVIRQHYEMFESRRKDYIAEPKRNGYRSVHMTVLPHGGSTPLEIQVRSEKMHHVAEFGSAAHWIYKDESARGDGDDEDDDLDLDMGLMGGESESEGDDAWSSDGEDMKVQKGGIGAMWCDSDSDSDSDSDDNDIERENGGDGPHARHGSVHFKAPAVVSFAHQQNSSNNDIRAGGVGEWRLQEKMRHAMVHAATGGRGQEPTSMSSSTQSMYPRPRVDVPPPSRPSSTARTSRAEAAEKLQALEREQQSMRWRGGGLDELQHEMRSGYVTCLAAAIRTSRVIVGAAGQLYGLAVGSTLLDLASGLGVATLGAIAVVNGSVAPLTQRLEMNDIVRFVQL